MVYRPYVNVSSWPRPCENRATWGLIWSRRRPASRPHRLQQSAHAQDHHHTLHIVGEDVQRHLGGYLWQLFREKVCCSHPTLHCAERMLRCLTADTHCIGVVVEPILNSLQNSFVLPA